MFDRGDMIKVGGVMLCGGTLLLEHLIRESGVAEQEPSSRDRI